MEHGAYTHTRHKNADPYGFNYPQISLSAECSGMDTEGLLYSPSFLVLPSMSPVFVLAISISSGRDFHWSTVQREELLDLLSYL